MSEETIVLHAQESQAQFLVYTGNFCGYCTTAKRLLERSNLTYTEYNFDDILGCGSWSLMLLDTNCSGDSRYLQRATNFYWRLRSVTALSSAQLTIPSTIHDAPLESYGPWGVQSIPSPSLQIQTHAQLPIHLELRPEGLSHHASKKDV